MKRARVKANKSQQLVPTKKKQKVYSQKQHHLKTCKMQLLFKDMWDHIICFFEATETLQYVACIKRLCHCTYGIVDTKNLQARIILSHYPNKLEQSFSKMQEYGIAQLDRITSCIGINMISSFRTSGIRKMNYLHVIVDFDLLKTTSLDLSFLEEIGSLKITFTDICVSHHTCSLILPRKITSLRMTRIKRDRQCWEEAEDDEENDNDDEENAINNDQTLNISQIHGVKHLEELHLDDIFGDDIMFAEFFAQIAHTLTNLTILNSYCEREIGQDALKLLWNVSKFKFNVAGHFVDLEWATCLEHVTLVSTHAEECMLLAPNDIAWKEFVIPKSLKILNLEKYPKLVITYKEGCGCTCACNEGTA